MEAQCMAILEEHIGSKAFADLDVPVINYLVDVLAAQVNVDTASDPQDVVQTIAKFLRSCGCVNGVKQSEQCVEKMMGTMRERGMLPDLDAASSTRLDAPIQLGRMFERTMNDTARLGIATTFATQNVDINTNDDLNWEEKREQARLERRRRKEEEKKSALLDEYEEYLASRGISSSQQAVKIHRGAGETRGTEDIHCTNIHINMGKTVLLDKADLHIYAGRRYGLVGRNGVGKTTLLRFLAEGELEGVSPYLQILHIEQEYNGDDRTALQAVLDTDVERTQLIREEQNLLSGNVTNVDVGTRLTEIYQRMEEIDAHGAEARAYSILSGLSFTSDMMHQATKTFSGGWRMRISLARALFISPDVLLLDEPTNHLDLHAVLWLEHTLLHWEKTLVVVSHSRSFLNSIATDIIHYQDLKLTYYKGNYNQFEQTRYENLKNQASRAEAQDRQRKHMQAFVDRWRYNAKRAKMAQSRLKALSKMEFLPAVAEDPSFQFTLPDPEPVAPPYIQVIDVSFGYVKGRPLFTDVNIGLDNDTRLALVGANGSGKSTFLNVVFGDLEPTDGRVIRNGKIRIAHFAQHHIAQLTLQMTALEFMKSKFPSVEEPQLRAQLGRFGISGDKALQPIYTLSGGQKSRVAFSMITFNRPHFLLLDEPTNHLDLDTVDALIEAINCYSGGVLIISHDEHLISSVCDDIWMAGGGKLTKFEGEFADYKKLLLKEMTSGQQQRK